MIYNSIWVTTNPTNPDTDNDGLSDGWERLFSFHPNDSTDGFGDDDDDGLRNGIENSLGTNLWNDDSDGDGILVFPDGGWVVNANGELVIPPPAPAVPPEPTWTQHFDEERQMWEGTYTTDTSVATWWWVYTNPLLEDSDGDDMPDGWEYENWLHPNKASDASEDPDTDTLSNLVEYLNGTDPWLNDTDEDALSDGHEVNVSLTDPLDPLDPGENAGGTVPIDTWGITTMGRYQTFGVGGIGSSNGNGSGNGNGNGRPLTIGGGGIPFGSQNQGHGNNHEPETGAPKQTERPTSDEELYLEVRWVGLNYGPAAGEGPASVGGTGTGAVDGHTEEIIDPSTGITTLVWIPTGGGSDDSSIPESDEPTKYSGEASWQENGRFESIESNKNSSVGTAINYLSGVSIKPVFDWDSQNSLPAASGSGTSFTAHEEIAKTSETAKQEPHGSGAIMEARLVRKTAPDGTDIPVERDTEKTFLKVTKSRRTSALPTDKWTIDEVEVLKLMIPSGESKSIMDKENPVPDAVLKPKIRVGWETVVNLLPVEFEDEELNSGLDDVTEPNWFMIPQDDTNRLYAVTGASQDSPIDFKSKPETSYSTPTPSTVTQPRELLKFEGRIVGDSEYLVAGVDPEYSDTELLNFHVREKIEIRVTVHPITSIDADGNSHQVEIDLDAAAIKEELNKIFSDQAHLVIENVNVKEPVGVYWDHGGDLSVFDEIPETLSDPNSDGPSHSENLTNNGYFDVFSHDLLSPEEQTILSSSFDGDAHFNVYIVASMENEKAMKVWQGNFLNGKKWYNGQAYGWAGNPDGILWLSDLIVEAGPLPWGIAHEMGHQLFDVPHTNGYWGRENYIGRPGKTTGDNSNPDFERGLMNSDYVASKISTLIVKWEADQITEYFDENP